ncbi:MAG: Proline--tRNA ligase [Clostridia bacterium 41_269]|nr:MAG: Proline--tRNA ligase [Clostridia bacterium 41_269]
MIFNKREGIKLRASEYFTPTLREIPSEAEIPSHQLLLKAGMVRKAAAGIYTYLPMGYRVIEKIMKIIREEMNKAGGQELLLPILQPAGIWKESGRWDVYGEEMFRLKDRHGRDFCLGPTHEEIITILVRTEVSSYKQLPLLLYQIQNKYRDEKRPRFGPIRGREFIMKDLYSFDRDEAGMKRSYEKMYQAYINVFNRCGLKYKIVEADTGAIGGNKSHEFIALADTGEAEIVYCDKCDYAANVEIAPCKPSPPKAVKNVSFNNKELVHTPGLQSIEEVSQYLKIDPEYMIKSLIYEADGEIICVLIRGDRQINEIKLKNKLGCSNLYLAEENDFSKYNIVKGYVGPLGLKDKNNIKIIADLEIPLMDYAVVGANRKDYHYVGVNPQRDIDIDEILDIRFVEEGEPCPNCSGTLHKTRGIEVGQIFQLGDKYSDALNAVFTDENGKAQKILMGCYGIGVSRTMAAAIEQNHDKDGIIWPISIAPFHVVIIPVSEKDEKMMNAAEKIYKDLNSLGIEVMLDDRDERAGVKFKDADLIGYPYRITVGKKTISDNTVDVKSRLSGEEVTVKLNEVGSYIKSLISE